MKNKFVLFVTPKPTQNCVLFLHKNTKGVYIYSYILLPDVNVFVVVELLSILMLQH